MSFRCSAVVLLICGLSTLIPALPAAGHDCGPPIVFVTQGNSIQWVIDADLEEVTSTYTILQMPNPAVATVSWAEEPANPFEAHDAEFTITGVNPGTTVLVVHWVYEPTGASNTCGVQIEIQSANDCNGNGADDAVEISNGTVTDHNGNDLPDECDATFTIKQMTWVGPLGTETTPLTDFGQLIMTAPAPAEDELAYVNVLVDDTWVIRNAPFFRIDRGTDVCTFSYHFPLDTTPGVAINDVDFSAQISSIPMALPPIDRPVVVTPVSEHLATPGAVTLADGSPSTTHVPTGPQNYFGSLNSTRLSIKGRANIPQISEQTNFCAAGALARSIGWMIEKYGLSVNPIIDDIESLMTHTVGVMDTTEAAGTDFANTVPRLTALIDLLDLEEVLEVSEVNRYADGDASVHPDLLAKAICEGKDAYFELEWLDESNETTSAHAMIMAAVAIDENTGETHFAMVDDGISAGNSQGDGIANMGFGLHQFESHPSLPGQWRMTAVSNNRLRRVLVICPRRASMVTVVQSALLNMLGALVGDGFGGIDIGLIVAEAARIDDVSQFTAEMIHNRFGDETELVAAADELNQAADELRDLSQQLEENPDGPAGDAMITLIEQPMIPLAAVLLDRFDCNGNDIDDGYEIETGLVLDVNTDGIPDGCQCVTGDTNFDGVVNVTDLLALLAAWGPCAGECPTDFDNNGVTNVSDLLELLAAWGPCELP